MSIKLKDLSELLGLSQTTVSRALNGYPEVGEKTRARVAQAAREHEYHPNPSAQRLATGRSGTLGIILPAERNLLIEPLFVEYLAGVAETTAETGFDITISTIALRDEALAYRRMARGGRVDGLLLSSPLLNDPRIALLNAHDADFVLHGRIEGEMPCAFLDIDNEGAFYAATRLLLDLGHQRIVHFNADQRMTFATHRGRGFQRAMAERGLWRGLESAFESEMQEEEGFRLASLCLARPQPPTAFVCASVLTAMGVMRAARGLGLRIGDDLALVAHDDQLPFLKPEFFDPPLSTTQSSIRNAGRRVSQMLLARISGTPAAELQEIWSPQLVVRASTPPCKRR